MNERTRKRLEAAGARVTTVKEFLGLSDADINKLYTGALRKNAVEAVRQRRGVGILR